MFPFSIPSLAAGFARNLAASMAVFALIAAPAAMAQEEGDEESPRPMFIRQYRVKGADRLPAGEVQEAVYPFLGPGRLPSDVDAARAALERAYHDKGFRSVTVSIPMQRIRQGVVTLEVDENPVGRVRVRGAEYTSAAAVLNAAPSMREGELLDFDGVTRDVVALNRTRDRQVTPSVQPGVEPGTLDIDLEVEDSLPLHGSLELNNRYSAGTSELRLNGSISYGNLWQRDHTLGLSFQIAPEDTDDAQVFSAYYLTPLGGSPWTLMAQALKQDSNVSTLGGLAVAGRGEVYGLRLMRPLPARGEYQHTLSLGLDYKDFDEDLDFGEAVSSTPVRYMPFSAQYQGQQRHDNGRTDLGLGLTWHFRGLAGSSSDFGAKRFGADGSFILARGELSHLRELGGGFQAYGRIQGQASSQPLVNNEQFPMGGLGTVRGYLESEALGDHAVAATFELRSPSLLGENAAEGDEWRLHAFADIGRTQVSKALPGQSEGETLSGVGLGMRGRLFGHVHGSLDSAYPLSSRPTGLDRELLHTFRLWGEF